jgi:PAS domain S-box-containing protein
VVLNLDPKIHIIPAGYLIYHLLLNIDLIVQFAWPWRNPSMTNYETNQALGEKIEALSTINRFGQEIALNVSKPDFMTFVYDQIYSIIKPDLCLIYLIEGNGLQLQGDPLKHSSLRYDLKQHHQIGECLCGIVAETGELQISDDISVDPRCTLEECKRAGIRSFAALPLEINGKLKGVLGIASTARRRFDEQLFFLQLLAVQISIGVNSLNLYDEARKKNNLLEAELTRHQQTMAILRESEENYRHLVKHAPTAIYEVDTVNSRFKRVNDAMCRFLGYTKEELLSMNPLEILTEESKKARFERMRKISTGEKVSKTFEKKVKAKNGREYWALFNSRFKYVKGTLNSATVVVHDITDRKQSEEALRESEKRYHALANATFEAIFISENGYCIDANQRAAEMFGINNDELIGMFGTDVIAAESKETVKHHMLNDYQAPYEVIAQKKDGTRFHVEIRGRIAMYRGRKVRITVVRDINERKIAEDALVKAHKELERKVDARTFELAEANRQLKDKADNLKEANIALNVLLKKREDDKKELEEKILLNVKELVVPYLKKLRKSGLNDRQKTLTDILDSNLNGIISPFLFTLSAKYASLTPKEIRVANLVRDGKTTKEIARLLISSTDTIDFHRKNIRKKLGLQNTKSNLRSYLLSLPK